MENGLRWTFSDKFSWKHSSFLQDSINDNDNTIDLNAFVPQKRKRHRAKRAWCWALHSKTWHSYFPGMMRQLSLPQPGLSHPFLGTLLASVSICCLLSHPPFVSSRHVLSSILVLCLAKRSPDPGVQLSAQEQYSSFAIYSATKGA